MPWIFISDHDSTAPTPPRTTDDPKYLESAVKASLNSYAARNYHDDPNHKLTNTSLIWSDYYLHQALLRYQQITTANAR